MASAQSLENPPINQVQFKDQTENQHIKDLAKNIGQATNGLVDPNSIVPVINQNPLPQFDQPMPALTENSKNEDSKADPEILDMMEGMQGKPRNAKASSFLKSKLEWMKKKFGPNVGLNNKG